MDVVMAIAPQSAIDTMIACVKKAGRTAVAIDVEPMSMARSIQTSYDDELLTKTICMVDMGNKTTSINIFRGAKLLMPRQIPIGGEMFTKAIADALTISNSEAEEQKLNNLVIPENAASAPAGSPFGAGDATEQFQPYNPFSDEPMPGITPAPQTGAEVPDTTADVPAEPPVPQDGTSPTLPEAVNPSSTTLFNANAPILDEFVAEIRRSIDYFKSRGGEIDLLLLCGGGTKTPGMSSFLAKTLGIPCDQYDPLRRLNVNARKIDSDFLAKHKTEFAIAVGNALHIFFD
jgi:type IV pilus assembly protein PilM